MVTLHEVSNTKYRDAYMAFSHEVYANAVVVLRTRPRAIPLAMITMSKSTRSWVSFSFLYEYGAPLRATGAPLLYNLYSGDFLHYSFFYTPHFPHTIFSRLLIFHTPHFSTLSIFHTPHFPHSPFSIFIIFLTPYFPRSSFSILRTLHSEYLRSSFSMQSRFHRNFCETF